MRHWCSATKYQSMRLPLTAPRSSASLMSSGLLARLDMAQSHDVRRRRVDDRLDLRRQRLEGRAHLVDETVFVIGRTDDGHDMTETALADVSADAAARQQGSRRAPEVVHDPPAD